MWRCKVNDFIKIRNKLNYNLTINKFLNLYSYERN